MPDIYAENDAARATHILLVEDNASDVFIINDALRKYFFNAFDIVHAGTESAALHELEEKRFDVCLLDLSLPDAFELSALERLMERAPGMPVLILTGMENDSIAQKAVASGAQDYLIKNKADGAAIRQAIDYAIERKRHQGELAQRAFYDPLTGLARRELFMKNLETSLARTARSDRGVAVFFMDLNRFKAINDTWGHATGDHILQTVAGRLKKALRPYDVAARFGGDEFAILIDDVHSLRDCAAFARKLLEKLAAPVMLDEGQFTVGISIGIATRFQGDTINADQLVKNADRAMYLAKGDGSEGYAFFTQGAADAPAARLHLSDKIFSAVQDSQLQLYYQPRLAFASGGMTGAEALLRWNHPERGLLTPSMFMPLAEHAGLAGMIDKWALERLARDMERWRDAGLPDFPVSLNLSADSFRKKDYVLRLLGAFAPESLAKGRLAIDVPEAALTSVDMDDMRAMLDQLARWGIKLHLDHFGQQSAALLPAFRLPFDVIRLDRSLIDYLDTDMPRAAILFPGIIDMVHRLDIRVGCIGVENENQASQLHRWRCDEAQGFALAVPMTGDELVSWHRKHTPA